MSKTPWTNNHERIGKIRSSGAVMSVVPAVYVRELEKELIEARAEIERINGILDGWNWIDEHKQKLDIANEAIAERDRLIEQMIDALQRLRDEEKPTTYHDCIDDGVGECAWCQAMAALSAAERIEA